MNVIKVNTTDLLEIIKKNRAQHEKEYRKALKRFRVKARKQMEKNLRKLESSNGRVDPNILHITMPAPQVHTDDYDTVIGMLEMHDAETIELEQDDYRSYVQDKWRWSEQFAGTNSLYGKFGKGR